MKKWMLAGVLAMLSLGGRSETLTAGKVEVVVSTADYKTRQSIRFAAEEMTNYLSRVLGAPVPLRAVNEKAGGEGRWTTEGVASVVLGDNAWSRAAGIDVSKLKRDGFVSGAKDGKIFIAGRDDARCTLFGGEYDKEIATLYGVYDFLERYAGCRFYFPGELGEIVPRKDALEVPNGLWANEPDWKIRRLPVRFAPWFEPQNAAEAMRTDRLFRFRLRHQTQNIPCCHGLSAANYSVRFGKEHPEYFQLKNGKRTNVWVDNKAQYYHSMLCHTSGIWDEVYKDAVSYFRGEGPEVRGRVHGKERKRFRCFWGWNVAGGKYFDAQPQDGMSKCECPNCQAAYAKAKDPDDWANELIWGNTVKLANRLKAAGFGDRYITQMAYYPYKRVPEIDIPDNVLVMVASNGSWVEPDQLEKDIAMYRAWNVKRNGTIWAWNNTGKHGCFDLNIRDYPCVTPRAFGAYYRRMAPIVFGAYCDNSAERFLYSALNYYVFSKVAWDHQTDVNALLDEYYRLMFGKAADSMRHVFETIEDKWLKEAIGHATETPLGQVPVSPTPFEVWTKIYNPSTVRVLTGDFAAAGSAVSAGSLEARRVALMKREFLDPILRNTSMYLPDAVEKEEARRTATKATAKILLEVPSVAIEVTDEMRTCDVYDRRFPVKIEPGRTYRVSYFLTCEQVKPYPYQVGSRKRLRCHGGVQCVLLTTSRASSQIAGIGGGTEGHFKRMLQEYTVKVPEKLPENAKPQIVFRMYNRTGKAVFEDLIVEEVRTKEKQ